MSIKHLSIVFFLRRNYTWGTVRQFTRIWMVTILHCNLSLYIRTACISQISACIFPLSLSLNGKKNPHYWLNQKLAFLRKASSSSDLKLRTSTYVYARNTWEHSQHANGNEHWTILTLMSTNGFYFHNFCELDSTKNRNEHLESAVPLQ